MLLEARFTAQFTAWIIFTVLLLTFTDVIMHKLLLLFQELVIALESVEDI